MDNLATFLGTTSLFKGMPSIILNDLASISMIKKVRKEEQIFNEGDDAHGFYMVMDGMVKIFKVSSEGREQILHMLGPGEPFGEAAVFAGNRFPANAMSLHAGRIIYTAKQEFYELAQCHPSMLFKMLAMLSIRLRKFAAIIETLSLKEVPARLAAFVLMISEEKGNKDTFQLDMTKIQVANILGTTPETLSRTLKLMHDKGYLSYNRKQVSIMNRAMLEMLSEGVEKIR